MNSFFSAQNLFGINPVYISPQEKLFLFAGGIVFLVSIVIKIAAVLAPSPIDKEFRNKFYRVFLFFGLGEIVWYFLRSQNVKFFGSLFAALVVFLFALGWLVWVMVDLIKNYKSKKEVWEKEQIKQKYLNK